MNQLSKTDHSHWLIITFILLVLLGATLSECQKSSFSSPKKSFLLRNPFTPAYFQSIHKITFKNRYGPLELERISFLPGEQQWVLKVATQKQPLPLKEEVIQQLFNTLENLSIRKVFEKDHSNLAQFSLHAPLVQITFEDQKGKGLVLEQGLINPIDSSTYLSIKNMPIIYQVDIFSPSWDGLDLVSLSSQQL